MSVIRPIEPPLSHRAAARFLASECERAWDYERYDYSGSGLHGPPRQRALLGWWRDAETTVAILDARAREIPPRERMDEQDFREWMDEQDFLEEVTP